MAGGERESFIDDLLQRMSLPEKIGQLNHPNAHGSDTTGAAGAVDIETRIRAGQVGCLAGGGDIAELRRLQTIAIDETANGIPLLFTLDVIHGFRTVFPLPLGLACSWNMDLVQQTARVAAIEAAAAGINITWAPMLDVCRDARWGRIAESPGEDPYLASRYAAAMVEGFQGDDLSRPDTVMATAKHFAGYGLSEAGRDYHSVDVSAYAMHNTVLPPFQSAVSAGAGAVMVGFNALSGVPVTAHRELLQDVLYGQWGYQGLLVSDYTAIAELINHGVAADLKMAALLAFKAGVTIDLICEAYHLHIAKLVDEGAITEAEVDRAAARVLRAKYDLGLFSDPYLYMDEARYENAILTPPHRALARRAAQQSCVLLKNENDVLPLPKEKGTIALIGPLADSRSNMQGTWAVSAKPEDSVTMLEGMRRAAGNRVEILHAGGVNIVNDANIAARLNIFGETAPIDERGPDALVREALSAAAAADVIVACVGEAKEHSGESATRTDISLPGSQQAMLSALRMTGKPLVVVVFSGRPLALEWESQNADALLQVWFPGTEAGHAIADLLFGNSNPSGKLAVSLPRVTGQCPIYYAELPTGRPIDGVGVDVADDMEIDATGQHVFRKFTTACRLEGPHTPLYPFGYGLSYSRFVYGRLIADKTKLVGMDDRLTVQIEVTNDSDVDGDEIVQLYVSDPVASRSRPVRELKAFQRIALAARQTGTVVFDIGREALQYCRAPALTDPDPVIEPGEFHISVGPDSQNLSSVRITWQDAAA